MDYCLIVYIAVFNLVLTPPPTASSARAAMFVLCEESNTVSDLKIKQRRKITEKNKLDDVAVKIESSMKIFRSEKNLEIIRRNI